LFASRVGRSDGGEKRERFVGPGVASSSRGATMSNTSGEESRLAITEKGALSQGQDPTWDRLEQQLDWYDRKSTAAQRSYKGLKLIEIVAAAAVPPLIGLGVPSAVPAVLGVVVVVLEGAQQLFQFQSNWITYRSTAEALKHERYLYLAAAGPYAGQNRHRVLAERLEGLVSQEHAKWTHSQLQPSDEQKADVAAPAE
jgi:hypothetical protein